MVDRELLILAVHFAQDSFLITDNNLQYPGPEIVYVNPAFTRMTGYRAEEVLGRNPGFLQGPKTDSAIQKILKETLSRGEVFYGQTVNYRKDGSEFINEWHIEPIKGASGVVTHYLAIQRDVSERVEAQRAIEQKNAALRELLEQVEFEKKKIAENVQVNVERVVRPLLTKLKRKGTRVDRGYLQLLEQALDDLAGSFGTNISQKTWKLSAREIEIANMIKNGLSNKEICQKLNISAKTIETHRSNIRSKLGLVKQKINLASYLHSV